MIAPILAVILTLIAAIFLCRRCESVGRKPSVVLAIFVSVSVTLISWGSVIIAMDELRVFTSTYWTGSAKPGAAEIVLPVVAINIAINLFISAIIVSIYQRRMRSLRRRQP